MIPKILKNKLTKTLFISFFVSVIVALLMVVGFLGTWETMVSDAFYAPSNTLDDIVIVAIDDQSLLDPKLGGWPFPRDRYVKVIENLKQSKVIGIDIIFDLSKENDTELADSLKGGNVVLAMIYTDLTYRNGELYAGGLLKPNVSLGTSGVDFKTGFVNLYTDELDKVTRSFPLHISGYEDFDHFSIIVAGEYLQVNPNLGSSRMLINFYGNPGDYEYISFSDVYNNEIDPSYFQGKIVLIGYAASDTYDHHIVPISNQAMPGVEIHANIVQSIVLSDYIYYQDDVSAIGVIFLFGLLAGILLFRFRIHIATVLLAVLFIAYVFYSIYTFDSSGIIMKIIYPLLSIIMVYIALVVVFYLTEERSRKWITSIFGKYVSPVVIDNLIKNPDKINLGGERRNITIFFSDIRGFTAISEELAPEELVHLLNEYLTEMTSIIIKDQGLVDKYMGDAIMAFWGAPLDQPDHAEIACSSSLEMIDKLRELQKKWKQEGLPSFNIGIGLNSGDAIVGNMGSSTRFDYTAMGDNVNLASRLEGLNKLYGSNIIISEYTHKIVKNKFDTRMLDIVKVKGKKKPILIYELLSRKDELNKKQRDFIKLYETGIELYINKKWKPAIKSFQGAIKLMDDNATHMFIARCNELQKNPPSKDWDGVWEIKTK